MKHSLSIGRVGLLALAVLFPLGAAAAQSRYYWSAKYDSGNGLEDVANDLAISPQGQIFVAATSANPSNSDALVQAYDPYGHLAWQNRIDFGGHETANMLAFDALTNDIYVVGTSSSGGFTHWLILRMSAQTGAIVWQDDYFGPLPDFGLPMSMALPAGGGVVVGGFFGTTSSRAFVASFDAAGALTWEWIHAEPGSRLMNCPQLAADPGGDIAVRVTANTGGSSWKIHRLSGAGALRWSTPIGSGNLGADGPRFDSNSNIVFAVNATTPVIGKLDVAGNLLWSVPTSGIYGTDSNSVAIAPGDEIVALSADGDVARLDPSGNLLWVHLPPPLAWFEPGGIASGLSIASNGDAIVRLNTSSPYAFDHFDAVLRWDAGGNFLWSQSVRNFEPNVDVQTTGLVLAPQGSVLVAGSCRAASAPRDIFLAAVRESSHLGCFGDGSSGPCPCGNTTAPGVVSGCLHNNSHLFGARLDDQGIASLGSDSLRFSAGNLPPSGIAVLLQGLQAATPFSFQDGRVCMQGTLRRIGAAAFSGTTAVDVAPPGGQRVHERSAALGDPIQPGTSRTYQLFYRGGSSVCLPGQGNLTNSVVVDWAP